MPTIESRICFDYNFNMLTLMYEGIAYIQNGYHWEYGKQELIAKVEDRDEQRMRRKLGVRSRHSWRNGLHATKLQLRSYSIGRQ